jgi:hypothetical protein
MALVLGATMLTAPMVSLADPKPIPLNPHPKEKPVSFPMKSEDFRPFFDKLMAGWTRAAAIAASKGKPPRDGWEERIRFRASQATEDGWVTAHEMQGIMDAGN